MPNDQAIYKGKIYGFITLETGYCSDNDANLIPLARRKLERKSWKSNDFRKNPEGLESIKEVECFQAGFDKRVVYSQIQKLPYTNAKSLYYLAKRDLLQTDQYIQLFSFLDAYFDVNYLEMSEGSYRRNLKKLFEFLVSKKPSIYMQFLRNQRNENQEKEKEKEKLISEFEESQKEEQVRGQFISKKFSIESSQSKIDQLFEKDIDMEYNELQEIVESFCIKFTDEWSTPLKIFLDEEIVSNNTYEDDLPIKVNSEEAVVRYDSDVDDSF